MGFPLHEVQLPPGVRFGKGESFCAFGSRRMTLWLSLMRAWCSSALIHGFESGPTCEGAQQSIK